MYQLFIIVFVSFATLKATADSYKSRKCKDFVQRILRHHGFPAPGSRSFPRSSQGEIDLTKFNQEKPEFTIETTPIRINKGVKVPAKVPFALTSIPRFRPYSYVTNAYLFRGRILKDGSYEFLMAEMNPQNLSASSIPDRLKEPQPIVHKFHFSKECSLQNYQVNQPRSPLNFKEDSEDDIGFHASADGNCVFSETEDLGNKWNSYIHTMSMKKKLERLYGKERAKKMKMKEIIHIVPHPDHYWEICHLAMETITRTPLDSDKVQGEGSKVVD